VTQKIYSFAKLSKLDLDVAILGQLAASAPSPSPSLYLYSMY